MMKLLLVSILVVIAAFGNCVFSQASEERNARLLVEKDVLNRPFMIIENKDVIIEYNLYNVGGSVAQKVSLSDSSMKPDDVNIVRGLTHITWDRIPPGTNVTHTVVIRPMHAGLLNLSSAEVSYLASEDATELQYAYTSAPGLAEIMTYSAYDRKYNLHLLDWAYFGLMTTPSLLLPFILWHKSRSKYEGIMRQAKKPVKQN